MIRVLRKVFSARIVLYLAGMATIFAGERLVGGTGMQRWVVDLVGLALAGGGLGIQWAAAVDADDVDRRRGHFICTALSAVGIGSVFLYGLSLEPVGGWLGWSGESLARWTGVWGAIWPAVWLAATIPLLTVDRALYQSPIVVPAPRIDQALHDGLAVAFGIAMLFPINYLADNHSRSWSLAYFETARAGSATRSVVQSSETDIWVYGFFPPESEVGSEVADYFAPLEGAKLQYRRVDQTAAPQLSRQLRVRKNGVVAVTNRPVGSDEGAESDDEGRVVEKLQLAVEMEDAEEKLETLDRELQKRLLAVSTGERVAYLTTGHGEFATDSEVPRNRRLQGFEKILEAMNFEVETLGVDQLADQVPDGADVVAVVGPRKSFLDSEIASLNSFLDAGGSVLLALEPAFVRNRETALQEGDPLESLVERFGTRMGEGVLASREWIVPVAQNKSDRVNLVTDRFSSHPSTATLSDSRMVVFAPTAGRLQLVDDASADRKVTVRSRPESWVDLNGNFEFDENSEEKKAWPMVIAASRSGDEGASEWRALVSADATMFSDLAIAKSGNQQFVHDGVNWLIGASGLSGSVDDEQDVRIRHTKEGQAIWFWGTIVAVPLLILAGGVFRVWRRQQGGEP